jgi:hypothetical protein
MSASPAATRMLTLGMASRSNLTVWTFPSVDGARRALDLIRGEKRIDGAAVISWTAWMERAGDARVL